jgi:hypothetical protein
MTTQLKAARQAQDVDEPVVNGTIPMDAVLDGDVVFFRRPGLLQSLCDRAGEPWRHAAMATSSGGVRSVAEVAGASFRMRMLADAVARSEAVAVARVDPCRRSAALRAAQWCVEHCGRQQVYAWDDMVLAGFIAVSRRYCLPEEVGILERGVLAAIDVLEARPVPPSAASYTCSAFVTTAFSQCGYPIAFDLVAPRALDERPSVFELVRGGRRPLRSGGDTRMSSQQLATSVRALVTGVAAASARRPTAGTVERKLIRWSTPGDLWRSASFTERYYVSRYSEPLAEPAGGTGLMEQSGDGFLLPTG